MAIKKVYFIASVKIKTNEWYQAPIVQQRKAAEVINSNDKVSELSNDNLINISWFQLFS